MPVPTITLNNGVRMPAIGLGTWSGWTPEDHAKSEAWIKTAIAAGYRHIDTALGYGTERYVGNAVRASGIPREEFFITTKLPWDHHGRVAASIEESLENLGLGYIDLYLVHWPQHVFYQEGATTLPRNPDGSLKVVDSPTFTESWAEVEKLLNTGKVRAIGVSNFSIKTLEKLFETAKIVPAINQVELHPYLAQNDLIEYCKKKGIMMTAYAPTGYATVRGDPLIAELAAKYRVSPTQIILAWHVARGTAAIPKSTNTERQRENISLPSLEEEDIKRINGLDKGERLCNKADHQGKVWGWTYEQLGW